MTATHPLMRGLDHVQLAMPVSQEAAARAFYGGVFGMVEEPKPPALVGRGGVWFRCGAQGLHLGVEEPFQPARKAHPALLVPDLAALRRRLQDAGAPVVPDALLPGYERFYTADPFGNRIECLWPVTPDGSSSGEIKDRVREMFGRTARAYVTSPAHAAGEDLKRLVELAAPQAGERALDASTGGGHTALAVAPYVRRVTVSDLTPRMLAAARAFLTESGVTNADYVIADAEKLPFLDASFELVTVRIAPHHYADAARAVAEMARVLSPGGRLVLVDNIAPEDPELDALVNHWEKWRDPSHVRSYTVSEWRAMVMSAGLTLTDVETGTKAHPFGPWVERSQMPDGERVKLEAQIRGAPAAARERFTVVEEGGRLVSWSADYVILRAVKPA